MTLVKRLFLFIFLATLGLPTFLLVEPTYYPHWIGAYLLYLLLLLPFSIMAVTSKKNRLLIQKTSKDLGDMIKLEADTKESALKLSHTCPGCSKAHALWTYLEEGKCPECSSDLWSTNFPEKERAYDKILSSHEKIKAFYTLTPDGLLKKARRAYLQKQ